MSKDLLQENFWRYGGLLITLVTSSVWSLSVLALNKIYLFVYLLVSPVNSSREGTVGIHYFYIPSSRMGTFNCYSSQRMVHGLWGWGHLRHLFRDHKLKTISLITKTWFAFFPPVDAKAMVGKTADALAGIKAVDLLIWQGKLVIIINCTISHCPLLCIHKNSTSFT